VVVGVVDVDPCTAGNCARDSLGKDVDRAVNTGNTNKKKPVGGHDRMMKEVKE